MHFWTTNKEKFFLVMLIGGGLVAPVTGSACPQEHVPFKHTPASESVRNPSDLQAQKFIEGFLKELTSSLRSYSDINAHVVHICLVPLMRKYGDLQAMGKFSLGRFWRLANQEQQRAFMSLLPSYIVRAYTGNISHLGAYDPEKVRIDKVRQGNTPSTFVVQSTLPISQQEAGDSQEKTLNVEWVVAWNASQQRYCIVDLIVSRISLIISLREEFTALLQRNQGNIQAFLQLLEKKPPADSRTS